jgi:hypothetical protein
MVKAFAFLRANSRETECVFDSRSSYVFVAHSCVSAPEVICILDLHIYFLPKEFLRNSSFSQGPMSSSDIQSTAANIRRDGET